MIHPAQIRISATKMEVFKAIFFGLKHPAEGNEPTSCGESPASQQAELAGFQWNSLKFKVIN
jgi:hypothetical protein